MAIPNTLFLRLTALATSLAAITLEDIQAIQSESALGPDVAANIQKLQSDSAKFDDEAIAVLNDQATADNLPPV